MKIFLAKIIYFIHLGLIGFILTSWLMPAPFYIINIFFIPAVIWHWKLNGGTCLLTDWENQLNPKELAVDSHETYFTTRLLAKFGFKVTENGLFYLIHSLLGISWLCSLSKFLIRL